MEPNTQKQTTFIDGFYSEDVPEKAPEWILGKGTLAVDKLIKFLNDNRQHAVNGGIKYTIKMAKTGKRYVEVDQYGMQKYKEWMQKNGKTAPEPAKGTEPEYTIADIYPEGEPLNFDTL